MLMTTTRIGLMDINMMTVQVPLTYWIWDGFKQNNTEDYQTFNSLFGEVTDTYTSRILTSSREYTFLLSISFS